MQNKDFSGKVALITGSSKGIGLEIARELGRRGAMIVLNARGKEQLESAHNKLVMERCEVTSIPADVSSPDECKEMITFAANKWGRLDIIINNAGISMRSNMEDLNAESCQKIVDINLLGCIYPTLYSIPEIKKSRGSIVFISSIAGIISLPTATLYCATKKGLVGLADSLRFELASDKVHTGVVFVGFTENDPDKKVLGPGAVTVPHKRPNHMSRKEVAKEVAKLIKKRKNRVVLTPLGKFVSFATWISPKLVEKTIIAGRKYNLDNRLGIH